MSERPKLKGTERRMLSDEVNRIAANAGADLWIHDRSLTCLFGDIERIIAAHLEETR